MASSDHEIDAFIADMTRGYEELIIEFVTEVVALLKEETPVETGHARANWIPSIGSAVQIEDGAVKTGKRKGRYTTGGKASDRGLADVLGWKLGDGDVFVANPVPYIIWLNYGTSDQATAGWVERCVDRAVAIVDQRNLDSGVFVTRG